MQGKVLALCGGVGGAKLAYGLSKVVPPEEIVFLVNTGDDFIHFDLNILWLPLYLFYQNNIHLQ